MTNTTINEDPTHHCQQFQESQLENERYKQRLEKLSSLLLEKDKKISHLLQYEYAFRKLAEQKLASEKINNQHLNRLNSIQIEKEQLLRELDQAKLHAQQLERVVHYLQERQKEAQLETDLFQEEYQKSQSTIHSLTEKLTEYEKRDQEKTIEILKEKNEKQETFEEVTALHLQFDILKKKLSESQRQMELYQNQQNEQFSSERQHMQESIDNHRNLQEKAEERLRIAQQHLAKKVKETAELNDKIHSQEILLQDLQQNQNHSGNKIAELQQLLETQFQQEQQIRGQLQEAWAAIEIQENKWEDKYLMLQKKWEESELQLKELKKLEEKYWQMQTLFTNLGGIFGKSVDLNQSIEGQNEEEKQPLLNTNSSLENLKTTEDSEYTPQSKGLYQNLFDMPSHTKHLKTDLFE